MRKRSRSSTEQAYDAAVAGQMIISTHVLDTERGEPARGIRVELFRGDLLLSVRETDEDGRIPDLGGIELEVELGEGHFHVPLLLSPYSCAIYRGS